MIYKITPDGKGAPFYQTKATHVIALAFQPDGQLLAGTESPGRLFRIDRAGKAFLLLDSTLPGDSRDPARSAGQHLSRRVERAHRAPASQARRRPTPSTCPHLRDGLASLCPQSPPK